MNMEQINVQTLVGVVILVVAFTVGAYVLRKSSSKVSSDIVSLRLMDHESSIMPIMRSVTTLTKYTTKRSIESQLRLKLAEMIKLNPWLTGRLTKSRWSRDVRLEYKPTSSLDANRAVDEYLEVVTYYKLKNEMSYDEYVEAFHQYGVAQGKHSINNPNSKLFAVTLVHIEDTNDVILVFSVSHMIADGFTYYKLYNMLDLNTPVTAMEVVRSTQYNSELITIFGEQKATWYKSWFIPVGLLLCALFSSPKKGYVVKVSKKWLAAQKESFKTRNTNKHSKKIEFVSTNDILVSWHNTVNQANVHIMAVDLRQRSPLFTDSMAGNYENSMLYNAPEDACSPEAIRRSLGTYRNASGSVPGVLKTLRWNGSLTTNWCSFYKQIAFTPTHTTGHNTTSINTTNNSANISSNTNSIDCQYRIHLPMMKASEMPVWREFMCIFNIDADTVGLLLFTSILTQADIEASGVGVVCSVL